ncbi:MAG: response regulator [Lachnospiraceae bacterium]|nr:response regulator [Lachnospiraceae bacterium]
MDKKVIVVEGTHGFVNTAIELKLKNAGFEVIILPDDVDIIDDHRYDADIVLYFPEGTSAKIDSVMRYLTALSREEHKTLCLVGEDAFIHRAKKSEGGECVYAEYSRPVNINSLVEDMEKLSEAIDEYHREKSILVIDDDNDFLTIMKSWLKSSYLVEGVRSGNEAFHYLEMKHPDLILLDYEMPGLDGYEVMDKIHKNPHTYRIPIIFLTGKNDRESVIRILKHKSDGYLLKSMPKEELLDNLERFFAESILKK